MVRPRRWDHHLIWELIPEGSTVLDLGCGNGELLARLIREKKITGQGVEADPVQVALAVTAGIPVYQSDLDEGLAEFKNRSFDYVVLEKTLQTLHRPMAVLAEVLRIGSRSIVSFPNFSHRRVINNLTETGRMPITPALPHRWYDTPNIHLCTLFDFLDWTRVHGVEIEAGFSRVAGSLHPLKIPEDSTLAEELLFVLK
jgi:methionine biosynthesis protein MetW